MEISSHPNPAWVASGDHVVEWQLAGSGDVPRYEAAERDVRDRIRVLETRAMTLVHATVTNSGGVAAWRLLAALDTETAKLRADLAWRRAETRTA
jgi:hypothetical protein